MLESIRNNNLLVIQIWDSITPQTYLKLMYTVIYLQFFSFFFLLDKFFEDMLHKFTVSYSAWIRVLSLIALFLLFLRYSLFFRHF